MNTMENLTGEPDINANDLLLAKEMSDALHANYPGHAWGVHVDGSQGIASVRNMRLSGRWGFVLHLGKMYSASAWKKSVVNAGGQLLEHFRLKAGRFNPDHYQALPTDFAGHHQPIQ